MNRLKNIFKKVMALFKPDFPDNNVYGKMYNDLGIFSYNETGFTISHEEFTKRLNWADITQINVYKVDLFSVDRIDMEIIHRDGRFTIHEELPGWYRFVLKTKDIFPSIPYDWEITIIHPAFESNYRTIYTRPMTPELTVSRI